MGFFRSGYTREYVTQICEYELKHATHITTWKMSMQQIMEMLVEMKATADADREERKAYREKMAADRKADQEKMAADRKADQDRMAADRKADQEEILARIKGEDRQANQELLARMDAMIDAYEKRRMACLGQTESNTGKIEQDTEMMQSAEEHQDLPSEDVVVRPVKGLKKRRKV
jgi:hypothetical protein